jgi:hypothetical protein
MKFCRIAFLALAALLLAARGAAAEGKEVADVSAPMAIGVYGGQLLDGNFSKMLYNPFNAEARHTGIAALTASYRLYRFEFGLSFELEAGIGRRFGDEDLTELWGGLAVRWDRFPWNDYVYTTLGAVVWAPNYATSISPHELERNDGTRTHWMNLFSPEITLADPDNKNLELVLRLHHRSGAFGLYNGTTAGSTFWAIGLRYHF